MRGAGFGDGAGGDGDPAGVFFGGDGRQADREGGADARASGEIGGGGWDCVAAAVDREGADQAARGDGSGSDVRLWRGSAVCAAAWVDAGTVFAAGVGQGRG